MPITPEIGEIVVCRITKILDYGAFVDLVEFPNTTGFVHISQVASSWIKNIRNFIREGQIRVAEVSKIDVQKHQIDLSFTKVSSQTQKEKIEEYRQSKRTKKLIELLAQTKNKSFEQTWQEVAEPLVEQYDYLYKAFESIAINGEKVIEEIISKEWIKPLTELVEKNIQISQKTLKAQLELHSLDPNGADLIKNSLLSAEKLGGKGIEMLYEGSGKFLVKSTAIDFKKAEKKLREVCEKAIEEIKKTKGTGEFTLANKKGAQPA